MNELINGNAIKMTSIEIAELVGSRPDNVKISIERPLNLSYSTSCIAGFRKINNLDCAVVSRLTSSKANKVSATALLSLPSCRRNSRLALLTVGESLKKLRLISQKRYQKRCALLLTLLSRKCSWKPARNCRT